MRNLKIIFVVLVSLLLLQCSKRSNPTNSYEQPIDLPAVEKKLVNSNNEFGLKLFREINKTEKNSNVFISPLSVSMCLGMVYNGADGETQKAMHQTLEFGSLSSPGVNECYRQMIDSLTQLDSRVEFEIANSIWYRLGLTPIKNFLKTCKNYFDALVRELDFNAPGAADIINSWIEENTNGKIKNMVEDPIDPSIVTFLINAIYFKGTWTYQFNEEDTKDDWFYLPDGSKKLCRMMEQRGLYRYFDNDVFQALDLPYGSGDFSMTILLPYWGTDIDSIIEELNQGNLNYWLDNLSGAPIESSDSINVYIPKFKLEFELIINDVLKALGMGIAFDPSQADFSKMYEEIDVWIGIVKHKTFIEVNEKGTEAAAVTITGMGMGPQEPGPSFFIADHPFIFLIREHQSKNILFVGKITDPVFE
ncbi:MAG: hypothetical protein AMJ90_02600 [candidate division Zixibacteria bacterium SM23_73_2]|nr:MAG: hypothetical protein AMJ90_02600 [candidate division Zixibacteria bacterium SM23_73_2]